MTIYPIGRIVVHLCCTPGSNVMVQYTMLRRIEVATINPSLLFKIELCVGVANVVKVGYTKYKRTSF